MKKRFISIVAIATIFGLTACGDDSGSNAKDNGQDTNLDSGSQNNPSSSTGTGTQDTHSVDSGSATEGILIDDRDGQKYKTVQIGHQIWMAENLRLDVSDGFCVDDIKANCEKYGVLYTSEASSRVCPEGWEKPSYSDWEILARNAGAECEQGYSTYSFNCKGYDAISKIRSTDGWDSTNGTNQLGLSLFPVGYLRSINSKTSSYQGFGKSAIFWGATISENTMSLSNKQSSEDKAKPIRCMKELPCERENEGEVLGVTVCDGSKWIEGSEIELATHLEKCDTTNLGKVINGYTCAMDGVFSWTLTENVVVAPDGYPYVIHEKDGIKYIQLRNKLRPYMSNAFTYEDITTVTCPDGWSFPQDNSLLTSCWTTELIQSCQTSDCSNQLNTSAYCIKN